MSKIGKIYWADMRYEEDPSTSEYRPVAIIGEDVDNGTVLILIMQLTSKGPKYPYNFEQTLKVPIVKWEEAGLEYFSYGKVNRTAVINAEELLDKDFIGNLDSSDLANLMHSYVLFKNHQAIRDTT